MIAWGVNFTFVKHVLAYIGVGAFMFIRFAALPLLGLRMMILIFKRRILMTWPRREDLPLFLACALIDHALVGVVMYGMNLSTAFSSSLERYGPLIVLCYTLAVFYAPSCS